MPMKAAFLALSAAALLPAVALRAQSGAPFVETTTLTFYWSFTHHYITNATTPVPSLPDVVNYDPSTLPSGYESYTDTIRPLPYTGPSIGAFAPAGGNKQLIDLLLQRLVRSRRIGKEQLSWRWQLIAVREAPANVRELATNPYRVFLSGQALSGPGSVAAENHEVSGFGPEPVIDDPVTSAYSDSTPLTPNVVTVDTGIRITLGQHSGNYTESNWSTTNNRVRNAKGNVATAFRVDFGALFYEDPVHGLTDPKTDPYNYHLKRNYWEASASGLINYNIRFIPAPIGTTLLPAFVATNSSATATGWFYHERTEFTATKVNDVNVYRPVIAGTYGASGIAPLKVVLSTVQYQKRDRFDLSLPDVPSSVFTETVFNGGLLVSWGDSSLNETGFVLERSLDEDGPWTNVVTTDANGTPFLDQGLALDTVYYYRVYAFNGGGTSAYSTTGVGSTVAAPFQLDAGADSATQITLKWIDQSGVETGFEVQRSRDGIRNWVTLNVDPDDVPLEPNTTTFVDSGLSSSTKYFYRVRALHDPFGMSAWSNIDDATTTAPATNNNTTPAP